MVGITREWIARSPALVFEIRDEYVGELPVPPSGPNFTTASLDSFLMMPEKSMTRTVWLLAGKLVQPAVHLFPSATKEAFRLITMVFE
jgi:hypothetical protein